MLGLSPGHVGQQPAARRLRREVGSLRLRRCGQADQAALEHERQIVRQMQGLKFDHPFAQTVFVLTGRPHDPAQQAVGIGQPPALDLGLDVGNGNEGRGMHRRMGHNGSGATTAHHQPARREVGHGARHRHAGAAVFGRQLRLGRNAEARPPLARGDAALDVARDATMKRLLIHHAKLPLARINV